MTNETFAKLGLRIKVLRLAKGQTQSQLAEACGYEPLTISRFERGTYAPSIETLDAIASALDVGLDEFFSDGNGIKADSLRHAITDLIYQTDDPVVLSDILKSVRKRMLR